MADFRSTSHVVQTCNGLLFPGQVHPEKVLAEAQHLSDCLNAVLTALQDKYTQEMHLQRHNISEAASVFC